MIFIISVIKTKENAVSFKSALSGVHQVQTPLPESVKASVPQPISQSQCVWGGWCCCDWSTAFWNQEIAGNLHWCKLCQQAGHRLPLFALSISQNVGHNVHALKQDLIEWNERSEESLVCFTLSFLPAWIMVMPLLHPNNVEAISSQGLHNTLLQLAAQRQTLRWIQVIEFVLLYSLTTLCALTFSFNSAWEIYWWELIETSNYFALISLFPLCMAVMYVLEAAERGLGCFETDHTTN